LIGKKHKFAGTCVARGAGELVISDNFGGAQGRGSKVFFFEKKN